MNETYTLIITCDNPIEITIPELNIKVTGDTLEEATKRATLAINRYRHDEWLKKEEARKTA